MSHFLILRNEQVRANAIALISGLNPNRTYSVEIKEYRKNRSMAQNRLYWMWVNMLAKDIGYEPEELHETFKARFLGVEERMIFGAPAFIPRSTAKLNANEFTTYLEMIEQFSLAMNIRLPHPEEYHYAMGYESAPQCASSKADSNGGRSEDLRASKPGEGYASPGERRA